ncbi:MAG TPA: alpha-amylase family glycosyl hydrolase [Streptosporangiaceae bacterium]|nr:alpha-amylase family glycosyl hydrolase [Streptosporangiaceae bacterium]
MNGVPGWLRRAVAYEIYPQSFSDSDGDGIGDLRGIVERLDYLAWLGVDVLWLNPCFVSPMRDAGYDVSDYFSVAARYGTNDDLVALTEAAWSRGIRVLLDLVAGHTSDRHPWFLAARDDPADHRYIFASPEQVTGPVRYPRPGHAAGSASDSVPWPGEGEAEEGSPGPQWVASPGSRPGWYLPNFFPFQPALNFGYARRNEAEPWREPVDAPGPRANRAALVEVIGHWLELGVAGFRVDLANTLVKDDPDQHETALLWREVRGWLDGAYPDAALLSEWNRPSVSVPAGFHADFYLAVGPEHGSLFNNGQGMRLPGVPSPGPCYFSAEGTGSPSRFLAAWRDDAAEIGDAGLIALFSSDHDFNRPVCGDRTAGQLWPLFAFLLTWPTLPGIHCGDEIGMRFLPGLPSVEGSEIWPGWNRAGARTPMQWDGGVNAGFSAAAELYLPVDPDPARPSVAAQRAEPSSLLHHVRRLITLRREIPALRTGGTVRVLHAGYPLVYLRGGSHLVVINPSREPVSCAISPGSFQPVAVHGVSVADGLARAEGFGYGIFSA